MPEAARRALRRPRGAPRPRPLLELKSVRAGYGKAEVLHDVDLTVGAGELVAVIGANGAGKSTLLKTIVGLVPLRSGTMSYDGARVTLRRGPSASCATASRSCPRAACSSAP